MYSVVLTLMVGLMLSLGGGANALTFGKDGKQIEDNAIPDNRTPAELLKLINSDGRLLRIYSPRSQTNHHYDFDWSLCSLVSHNLTLMFKNCSLKGATRATVLQEMTEKNLRRFKCGADGYNRHMFNYDLSGGAGHGIHKKSNCEASKINWTVKSYTDLLTALSKYDPKTLASATSKISNELSPSEFLEPIQIDSSLITLRPIRNHYRTDFSYDGAWNVCSATEHNLAVMLQKCPLAKNDRAVAVKEARERRLRKFQCGEDGHQRFQANIPSLTSRGLNHSWIIADCSDEKIEWTINQYKRLASIIDNAPGAETSVVEVAGLSASGSDTQTRETTKHPQTSEIAESTKKQTDNLIVQTPEITIQVASTVGPKGTIKGVAQHITDLSSIRVDGQSVDYDEKGNFQADVYVPDGGLNVVVEAFDVAGVSASTAVRLDRTIAQSTSLTFKRLNPIQRDVAKNPNALALVIGVANYRETGAKAVYADSDAKVFVDYAAEKLGVPRQRIKFLVNEKANEKEMLLAAKRWLARAALPSQSDIYIFFAGHGLASEDGEKMYLLPHDGAPELLEDTAVSRDRLFSDIAAANPRSVTVFLDTCYSGTTRGPDMLIASRPIAIRAKEQSVPDGFTVMTAAAGDQTAKPLEEAKHGMFSYFLMKGMEGDADANQDNQITAGELHAYVEQNVIQQSSGSQTPELQGDADRVLVRFQ